MIQGMAGSGKTYKMIEACKEIPNSVILSFTHSNCSTIRNMALKEFKFTPEVYTIHSYFGISIINSRQFKRKPIQHTTLLIDEFSLVSKSLVKIILSYKTRVVMFGDILQLNAIDNTNYLTPSFKLDEYLDLSMCSVQEIITIGHKLANSHIGSKWYRNSEKVTLMKNHRLCSEVYKIYSGVCVGEYQLVGVDECRSLLSSGYIFLSTRFKHLKYINEITSKGKDIKTKVGSCGLNQRFVTNRNYSKIQNNSLVDIKKIDNSFVLTDDFGGVHTTEDEFLDVSPRNLITITKSQGQTIDKVVVILDDIYSCDQIYTAIFRARFDCKMMILKQKKEEIVQNVLHHCKCFNKVKNMIYPE